MLVLEEWRAAEQDGRNQGDGDSDDYVRWLTQIESQIVIITLSEGEYQIVEALFTLRFCDLFLCEPANAQEDCVYYRVLGAIR